MRRSIVLVGLLSVFAACVPADEGDGAPDGPLVRSSVAEGSREREAPVVTFLGTSLTEGLGLDDPGREAWPAVLAELAAEDGVRLQIVNAGVSGETSAGALRRVDWVLRSDPDLLVVETGANDGLRGLPLDELESNLDAILRAVRAHDPDLPVVLVGMQAPPNMGPDYAERFRGLYPETAEEWDVHLVPFDAFLGEVASVPGLNQSDGIHPTAPGHRMMAEGVWGEIRGILGDG